MPQLCEAYIAALLLPLYYRCRPSHVLPTFRYVPQLCEAYIAALILPLYYRCRASHVSPTHVRMCHNCAKHICSRFTRFTTALLLLYSSLCVLDVTCSRRECFATAAAVLLALRTALRTAEALQSKSRLSPTRHSCAEHICSNAAIYAVVK